MSNKSKPKERNNSLSSSLVLLWLPITISLYPNKVSVSWITSTLFLLVWCPSQLVHTSNYSTECIKHKQWVTLSPGKKSRTVVLFLLIFEPETSWFQFKYWKKQLSSLWTHPHPKFPTPMLFLEKANLVLQQTSQILWSNTILLVQVNTKSRAFTEYTQTQ